MDIQQLSDRAEIADALARYTIAIDTGDFDLLDTVYTADAQIDYTESGGIAAGYAEIKPWLAANLPAFSSHRIHMLGQVSYEFTDADRAEVSAYFHNPMRIADGKGGDRVVEVGGIYHHTFARQADGWRSVRLHEQVTWTRGF